MTTTLCIIRAHGGRFGDSCFFVAFLLFHDLAGGLIFAHLEFLSGGGVYTGGNGMGGLFKKRAIISGMGGNVSRRHKDC